MRKWLVFVEKPEEGSEYRRGNIVFYEHQICGKGKRKKIEGVGWVVGLGCAYFKNGEKDGHQLYETIERKLKEFGLSR